MMTNGDPEGQIFLYHAHMNNECFFLLTIIYQILCLKMLPDVPEYAEMRHDMMMSIYHTNDVTSRPCMGVLLQPMYSSHVTVR